MNKLLTRRELKSKNDVIKWEYEGDKIYATYKYKCAATQFPIIGNGSYEIKSERLLAGDSSELGIIIDIQQIKDPWEKDPVLISLEFTKVIKHNCKICFLNDNLEEIVLKDYDEIENDLECDGCGFDPREYPDPFLSSKLITFIIYINANCPQILSPPQVFQAKIQNSPKMNFSSINNNVNVINDLPNHGKEPNVKVLNKQKTCPTPKVDLEIRLNDPDNKNVQRAIDQQFNERSLSLINELGHIKTQPERKGSEEKKVFEVICIERFLQDSSNEIIKNCANYSKKNNSKQQTKPEGSSKKLDFIQQQNGISSKHDNSHISIPPTKEFTNHLWLKSFKKNKMKCLKVTEPELYNVPSVLPIECMLKKNMQKLFSDDSFSDVTLIIDDQEIKVHRNILANVSEKFKSLFFNQTIPIKIKIEDVDFGIMKEMLFYIYTGKLPDLSQEEDAKKFLLAASIYTIKELFTECEDILCQNINSSNAAQLLDLANKCRALKLINETTKYILF